MFKQLNRAAFGLLLLGLLITGCKKKDPEPQVGLTGKMEMYNLEELGSSGVSGTVKFEERTDNSTLVTISLTGASGGHPAHIHANTAAETGPIVIDLTEVDASGKSETIVSAKNDGTAITYNDLINFDGYVNVHKSASELSTLLAQGDIGQNALTGKSESYDLEEAMVAGISGTVEFKERKNGETLVVIELSGTSAGGSHPAHVHANTVAEGGAILVSLNNVDGASGISKTNVTQMDDGTPVTYSQWADFNGYVQVHMSESELGTILARGDIGQNELTGKSETYTLNPKSDPNISGTATFAERRNGNTLVTIKLNGTSAGGDHPAHIHMNTAVEGGGIVIDLTNVDGGSGMSMTNVKEKNDGTPITYDDLIDFNGYINVHNSANDLGTLIAQGDIGQNALTGMSMTYTLNEQNNSGVSGSIKFEQRKNGATLVTIMLSGTMAGGDHPAHIHDGSVSSPGGIAISLSNVDGATGMSMTNVTMKDDQTAITYNDLINYNGYAQVHESAANLGNILCNGNIGSNN